MIDIERYDPSMDGKIAYEHWHRYAVCQEHARGLDVLDVACGEGYGAALLAKVASRVVGLDLNKSTIATAQARYRQQERLSFEAGSCRDLPFSDASFDLIVSMETLEHIAEQQTFLSEIKRVLRPAGVLIISTPNRPVYSGETERKNPFHVSELDESEFSTLISAHFVNAEVLAQRMYVASMIGPLRDEKAETNDASYLAYSRAPKRRRDRAVRHGPVDIEFPEYFLAVCSDAAITWPTSSHSIFIDGADDLWRKQEPVLRWSSGLHTKNEALRAQVRESETSLNRARAQSKALRDETDSLKQQVDAARHSELASAFIRVAGEMTQRMGLPSPVSADLPGAFDVLTGLDRTYAVMAERQAGYVDRERVFEQSLSDLRGALKRADHEADDLRAGIGEIQAERKHLIDVRRDLRGELKQARNEVGLLRESLMQREAALATASVEISRLGDSLGGQDAALIEARQQITTLRGDLDVTREAAVSQEQALTAKHGADAEERGITLQREVDRRARLEVQLQRKREELLRRRREVVRVGARYEDLRAQMEGAQKIERDVLDAELTQALASPPTPLVRPRGQRAGASLRRPSFRARKAVRKGDEARDQQEFASAAEHYRRALTADPGLPAIWVQYGNMLKDTGQHSEAEAAYLRALALDADSADTLLQLGRVRKMSGQWQGALDSYGRAFDLDPTLNGIQPEMAAVAHGLESASLDQQEADLLAAGNEARDRRDWSLAAEHFGLLLRSASHMGSVWVQYGHALKEAGFPSTAARAYRKGTEIRPLSADAWLQLGRVLALLNKPALARRSYDQAVALDPACVPAREERDALAALGSERDAASAMAGLDAAAPPPSALMSDDSEAEIASSADWPDLEPKYWLPQRLRDLTVERYGEKTVPVVSYLMGLVERFADKPDAFDPHSDGELLLENIDIRATRPAGGRMRASIVIPVFNNLVYTLTCIASILAHDTKVSFEIIVGDDQSGDETFDILSKIGGCIRVERHETNLGFLGNCNAAAATATGEIVILLNNDTIVLPGWLDALVETFDLHPDAGFAGSKLLNGDGSLQEAGGIYWNDGSAWNFGRNADPRLPEFNYVKEVDYVSGASIAVPRRLWIELNGFDPIYSPAYCEDADLAFRVRALGWRTLYQPASALIHHEGRSHGRDTASGVKAYQVVNQKKLLDRFATTLAHDNFPNGDNVFVARDRSRHRPHLLFVDHYIPQWDRDAGSRSVDSYLTLFQDRGFQVIFWPDNLNEDREYIARYQQLGIEVIHSSAYAGRFAAWLDANHAWIDYAVVSRPHTSQDYLTALRRFRSIKVIYYGHDVHFRRLLQQHAIDGDTKILEEADKTRELEERAWRSSDVVVYFNEEECEEVRRYVAPSILVSRIPLLIVDDTMLETAERRLQESSTRPFYSLMFVGGFVHGPNVDAVLWFLRSVMPTLRSHLPDVKLRIAGSNPPAEVNAISDTDVELLGRVSDAELQTLYRQSAAVILPLRYGGGVKGKLIEALANGVPVISTPTGVQGIPEPERLVFLASTAAEFAAAVIEACTNRTEAVRKAQAGIGFIRENYSKDSAIEALSPYLKFPK